MKVLFLGGTGIISTACTALAAERDIDLTIAMRGHRSAFLPAGVRSLTLDIADEELAARALKRSSFDAVVKFVAYTEEDIARPAALSRAETAVCFH